MAYLRGYLPFTAVVGVAATNGIAEVVVSSIIVLIVMKGLKNYKID